MKEFEFKISSSLKNIIGKDLITDDYIAIFELVKNSYDANAKNVDIIFNNVRNGINEKSRIFIIDNGTGMSLEDIRDKWLFVGYSEKKQYEEELKTVNYRDKIISQRIFAGAKGIGRFSCDRLGQKLKLYAKKNNDSLIHILNVDWSKFEKNSNEEFQSIKVQYDFMENEQYLYKYLKDIGYDLHRFEKGTILEISELNSIWDKNKLIELKRHLQRLINPNQIGDTQEFQIKLIANEYIEDDKLNRFEGDSNIINGLVKNIIFERLNIKTTYIKCDISNDGKKLITELYDKGEFIFKIEERNTYGLLSNVKIIIFYLNRAAKYNFTRLMGIEPIRYGSIFLYKNGIKINPYGNEGDDWLGLDRRKTQGFRRFFGNREIMGRIEINGYQPEFREVSSRDGGVIKSFGYDQLINYFMEKALKRLEKYVVEGIDWDLNENLDAKNIDQIRTNSLKIINQIIGQIDDPNKTITFNENLLNILTEKQIEKTPEIIKNLEHINTFVNNKNEKKYIEMQIKAIRNSFESLKLQQEELNNEVKQFKKQALFLKYVAEDNTENIIGLQHHIGISVETINNYILALHEKLKSKDKITNDYLKTLVDNISLQTKTISSIILYVTKANFNVMSETITRDIIQFIKEYVENVYKPFNETDLLTKKVNIFTLTTENEVFDYTFAPLDIIVTIDNLISNSLKAEAKKIIVNIKKISETELEIKVTDDGKGIEKKCYDNIFEFGFTTTTGSGIGLYQTKSIISKYGEISFNPAVKNGAEFIVRFRK